MNDDTLPDPSIIRSEDGEILDHQHVKPPTRLGSRGRIGKFEIIEPIGHGAMGHVFSAREPVTDTVVAIKILRSEYVENNRVVQTFIREARHMYQLSHPCILNVLEVSGPGEGPFLVMPMMSAGSLAGRIETSGAIPENEALDLILQVAEGLAHAHGKGLIHRDLKPANILLDEGGRVKISDFGLVRSYMGDSLVDASRSSLEGTPAYMSPKVAAGDAEDTRCDIYALGAVLYEMLCGRPPYQGANASIILQAVLKGPPVPLGTLNPKLTKSVIKVVECCMARELRDRYASMADVVEDLKRVKSGQAPCLTSGPASEKRKIPLWFWGIPLAVVLGLGGWMFFNRDNGQPPPPGPSPSAPPGPNKPAMRPSRPASDRSLEELIAQGNEYREKGEKRSASDTFKAAVDAYPESDRAKETFILHLIDLQHWRPARAEVNRWLEMDPANEKAQQLRDIISAQSQQSEGELPGRPPLEMRGDRRPPPAGDIRNSREPPGRPRPPR